MIHASINICFVIVASQGHSNEHHSHNNHGGSVPDSGQVDAAIVDIELHYNEKLCLELLLVDCATHVTQGDEKVCGSDGVTYDNHCKFSHAVCEFKHAAHHLKLASHGECPPPTAAPVSTMPSATAAPASTMPPATAAPAIQTGTGSMGMTTTVATTTTTVMMTTTTAATTVDPIHSIVQNVFCQNAASISCANDFQIICGSDGQLYPNQCEMSKQKCVDPTLTVADKSTCPIPGR
ncbi:ovomucoid-like [Mercenaria mercenaria]|uniref:ovomucoid-like n=1 Tax=Mercenaria mercenaria TaxID=6596 RepID=UPI00234E5FD5|nr:ovomucoid-like [Mercenaria mercenaria]